MEDLFGGECNMFNPAATEENDEDQPAGSQTLLQRAHGGTSCMCCSGGPLATSLLANSTDVSAAASGSIPDDEQPGNEEGSCVRSSVAPDHADSDSSTSSSSSSSDDEDILSNNAQRQIRLRRSCGDVDTPPLELQGLFGAAQRQSAPAAMQRGRGEVDDSRLSSVSAVTGGDNNPSTVAASDGPNANVNAAQSHANRAAARDVQELSRTRCSRANFVSDVATWSVNHGQYVSFQCHSKKTRKTGSGSCGCCHLKQTGRCCLQRLGGIDHAFAVRKEHWTVEYATVTPSDDSAAPVTAAAAVKQKRLQQKKRTAKLADLLQQMVHFSKDANGDQLFVEQYWLLDATGVRVDVCRPFFLSVMGYDHTGRGWREAMNTVKEAAYATSDAQSVVGDFATFHKNEQMARSDRGQNMAFLAASYIELNGQQMPNDNEIRLDVSSVKAFHEHIVAELQLMLGPDVAVDDMIVKPRQFQNVLKFDIVQEAIAIKLGFPSLSAARQPDPITGRVPMLRLGYADAARKRDFATCSTCAAISAMRTKALKEKNRTLFLDCVAIMKEHMRCVTTRRRRYYEHIALSRQLPNEHLTIILDAMDHGKLDSPLWNSATRWDKSHKDLKYFPVHLMGALSFGFDGLSRHLFFHDTLLGGETAGMNGTVEYVLRVLTHLKAHSKLPNHPTKRELHLQFDNCGDNKNWLVLGFAQLLVTSRLFTAVTVDFLPVGHTHENIDQMFRTVAGIVRHDKVSAMNTLPKLMGVLQAKLKAVQCEDVLTYGDFAKALVPLLVSARCCRIGQNVSEVTGHQIPLSYKFINDTKFGSGKYQRSIDPDSVWYPINFLRDLVDVDDPNLFVFSVTAMPLLCYKSMTRFWKSRTTAAGAVMRRELLREMIMKLSRDTPPILSGEDLQFWLDRLDSMADTTVRQSGANVIVNLKDLAVNLLPVGDLPVVGREATRDRAVALGLMQRENKGPCVTTRNSRAPVTAAPELSRLDQLKLSLIDRGVMLALRDGKGEGLGSSDLPRCKEWVVIKYAAPDTSDASVDAAQEASPMAAGAAGSTTGTDASQLRVNDDKDVSQMSIKECRTELVEVHQQVSQKLPTLVNALRSMVTNMRRQRLFERGDGAQADTDNIDASTDIAASTGAAAARDAEHYALGCVTKSFEAGSEASSQSVGVAASAANQLNVISSRRHSKGEVQLYLPDAYPKVMTAASWVEADHYFKSIIHGSKAKQSTSRGRKRQKVTTKNQKDKPEKQICSLSDVIVTQGLLGEALKPVSFNSGRAVKFKVSDMSSADVTIANTEELKFAIKTLIEHDRCFDAVKLGETEKVCGQCTLAFQKLSASSDSQRLDAAEGALVADAMGEYSGQSHGRSVMPHPV